MATGSGAAAGYDYRNYYGNYPEVPPEKRVTLKNLFGALGGNTTPVSPQTTGAGDKMRGLLGLAPPTSAQADVRKSDNAIAAGAAPQSMTDRVASLFGGGAVPAVAAPEPPVSAATPSQAGFQSQVRATDNAVAANTPGLVVDGAWAAPHGASPGIGAQLVAGPATTAVSSSRDANGNLVLTNAPPGGAAPAAREPALFQARPGSLASFYGAAMNQRRAAGQDKETQALALKLPELAKQGADAAAISQRLKLAQTPGLSVTEQAAILGGHAPPAPHIQIPIGNQPMTGADKVMNVYENGVAKAVPIRQQAPIQQGTDGKMYVVGPDGKALREATQAEVKAMKSR